MQSWLPCYVKRTIDIVSAVLKEEGKQLFEMKEKTVELVDQGKTCFHWSELSTKEQ